MHSALRRKNRSAVTFSAGRSIPLSIDSGSIRLYEIVKFLSYLTLGKSHLCDAGIGIFQREVYHFIIQGANQMSLSRWLHKGMSYAMNDVKMQRKE